MKLTRSWLYVLVTLRDAGDRFVPAAHLPDGNGRSGGANGAKLRAMRAAGVIEYGKNPGQSIYGYRITPAGRSALEQSGEK